MNGTTKEKTKAEAPAVVWREIEKTEHKTQIQEILGMLLDYDEKSGRMREYKEPELHYLRRAIACGNPAELRFFARDLGDFLYYVVGQLDAGSGLVATGWVHEDGIRVERIEHANLKNHPVHTIECFTDSFEAAPVLSSMDTVPEWTRGLFEIEVEE